MKIALLAGRVILGGVFIYAASVKLRAPWYLFAASIDSYQMLPPWAVQALARTLPWLELALGIAMIIGYRLRWIALASGVMLLAFWLSMFRAFAKGLGIDCGCFGPGEQVSNLTLLRDGALVALAGFLFWFSRPSHREHAPGSAT